MGVKQTRRMPSNLWSKRNDLATCLGSSVSHEWNPNRRSLNRSGHFAFDRFTTTDRDVARLSGRSSEEH